MYKGKSGQEEDPPEEKRWGLNLYRGPREIENEEIPGLAFITKPVTSVKGWITPVKSNNKKDVIKNVGLEIDLN